ncbi:MAG: hypothetical protein H7177_05570 [Rhizobacter sp.]|nr:hypothetical protein [Bacteriovorax sp.]
MKNFHKNLNIAFIGGLLGAVAMTMLGPKIIALLVTPPVSFGVNCEPATVYSMQKLIVGQIIGLVLGVILTFFIRYKLFGGKKNTDAKTA